MIPRNITERIISPGTELIDGLAFRKCNQLSHVALPDGIMSIGDAAFSYCSSLKKITIPNSVAHIGTAAFCCTGLQYVTFKVIPSEIDNNIFIGCQNLKRITVPNKSKDWFIDKLGVDKNLIVEQIEIPPSRLGSFDPLFDSLPLREPTKIDKQKCCYFNYNQQSFKWTVGDTIKLDTLFSDTPSLTNNPSYLFRRKALFVIMKSNIASTLEQKSEYEIPANVSWFTRKFRDKYGSRSPRIFLFVCDDGMTAQVYDEVRYIKVKNTNNISVKSFLRH